MAMTLDDFKKLSPQKKAIIICLIFIVLGYVYYLYFIQANLEKHGQLQTKLQELEQQIVTKERLASELGRYQKGVNTLKEAFNLALTKLPIRKEIPDLLNNVAISGTNAGIAFLLFEPQASVKKPIGGQNAIDQKVSGQKPSDQKQGEKKPSDAKSIPEKPLEEGDYYEEIPIKVTVSGGFHNTVGFFEKVARLSRIINVEDITMSESKSMKGKGPLLNTSYIMKTYTFVQKTGESGKKSDEKKQ